MVTHIVIFTWLPGVTHEQVTAFGTALDNLAELRSDITTIRHGRDLAFRDGNGDYALVATFADKAGWDEYQADPAHKAFVRDFVVPIQASRLTIQF
jgi:hypothetical protein